MRRSTKHWDSDMNKMQKKGGKFQRQKQGRFDNDWSGGLARNFSETGPEFPYGVTSKKKKQINTNDPLKQNRNRDVEERVKVYLRKSEDSDEGMEDVNLVGETLTQNTGDGRLRMGNDEKSEDMPERQRAYDSDSETNPLGEGSIGFWKKFDGDCKTGGEAKSQKFEPDSEIDSGDAKSVASSGGKSDSSGITAVEPSGSASGFNVNEYAGMETSASVDFKPCMDNFINKGRELTTEFEMCINEISQGLAELMEAFSLDMENAQKSLKEFI